MTDRFARFIRQKVLFRDVGDVLGFGGFGEQMVERLISAGADVRRNGLIPFFGVVEFGIHVEYDAPEGKQAMTHYLTDMKSRRFHECRTAIARMP